MALPASMTAPLPKDSRTDRTDARTRVRTSVRVGETDKGEGEGEGDEMGVSGSDEGESISEIDFDTVGDIDDDEVLRILSKLDSDENENENDVSVVDIGTESGENENSMIDEDDNEDDNEDDGEEQSRTINPAKQLQQKLKLAYSRMKGSKNRKSTTIGGDVFEVVASPSSSRVRDIRKSELSFPPRIRKSNSLYSAALTEDINMSNQIRNQSPGSAKGSMVTVSDALENLKKPFPTFRSASRKVQNNGVVSGTEGLVFNTNSRLRAIAESPIINSYSREEIERVVR